MKKNILVLLSSLLTIAGHAQFKVSGTVLSETDGRPIQLTSLQLNTLASIADDKGNFSFQNVAAGTYTLSASSVSFADKQIVLVLTGDTSITLTLSPISVLTDEVMISATRADEKTPVTFSKVTREDLASSNTGVDMPYLLNQLPSVVATSDAGNGIGYTGIRIRGTDPSRINVTVNGIPLNDAESQNVYWVDLPDLASSVENIQVQRGVGTSTNGAAAFGGSINIQTNRISTSPFFETNVAAGSFNTLKTNISFGSGLLKDHWFMEGRLSRIVTDGYIDRASSDLKSIYINTGYENKKTVVRLNIFSGKEITYQSWNGVPESRLKNDIDGMNEYIIRNFPTTEEADNLLNSGRTYNYYTYKDQVDNYQQDHYQLHYSHEINPKTHVAASLHYTYGRGYYEEFKYAEDYLGGGQLSSYGLDDVIIGNDTITSSDLVRRKWLKNDFYGLTFSLTHEIAKNQKLIIGGSANEYDGLHYHELTWMQYAGEVPPFYRYYSDDATKKDANIFAKYTVEINKRFTFYIDQQVRTVMYDFNGLSDKESNIVEQSDNLNFYNPKAGLYIAITANSSAYVSAGIANKEPNRDDYTESTLQSRPKPERLTDYEAGYSYKAKRFAFGANLYYMDYKDQLVLTGALNDVGNYTRTNAEKSYRTGVEITADFKLMKTLSAGLNFTYSENKIADFNEYITDYDNSSELIYKYENTDIAFSPSVIAGGKIEFKPMKNFTAEFVGKYVGEQYLDNTESSTRMLDAYQVFDLNLSYSIRPSFLNEIIARLSLKNIFDAEYVSNGYTYGYYSYGEMVRENLYYPQSGFNIMGQLTLKF